MYVANGPGLSRYEVLMLIARLSFAAAFGFLSIRWIVNQFDPTNAQKRKAKKKVCTARYCISSRLFDIT